MPTTHVLEVSERPTVALEEVQKSAQMLDAQGDIPVAKPIPLLTDSQQADGRAAAEGLRAASKGLALGGLTIRELIEEGRR